MKYFVILYALFLSSDCSQLTCTIKSNNQRQFRSTVMEPSNIINKYPAINNFTYAIDFNMSIMQCNYVYYISTSGGNMCTKCKYFRKDPYNINILRNDDYNNVGYDRGHIVPNADYGYETYIISNVVPMNNIFNRNIWASSERDIRNKYSGHLVYKGCDYSYDKFIINSLNHKLFIPIGCYYIVFDILLFLPNITTVVTGNVIDYGYYLNNNVSAKEYKLPWWIACNNNIPDENNSNSITQLEIIAWIIFVLILIVVIIGGLGLLIYIKLIIRKRKETLRLGYEDL